MIEKFIEKLAKGQDFYKNLKNDVEYLQDLVKRKTIEVNEKVEKIKQLEKTIEIITKIIKDSDARIKIVKEIKKVLKVK